MRDRPTALGLLIALVLFAPLAFGTVEPWSLALLESGVVLLGLAWLFEALRRRNGELPDGALRLLRTPGLAPLLLIVLWHLLQIVPLPPALVRVLNPLAAEFRSAVAPLMPGAAAGGRWFPLSVYPGATLEEARRILTWTLAYALTVQVLTDEERTTRLVRLWVGFGLCMAAFAILQHAAGTGKIYGFRPLTRGGGPPMGPYVNKNHFAGLMEMMLPLAVTTAIHAWPDGRRTRGLRDFLLTLLGRPRGHESLIAALAAVLTGAALFVSLSRGGILSALASLLVVGLLLARRRSTRRAGRRLGVFVVLILLAVGWIGWSPVVERFERLRNIETERFRYQVWRDTLGIVRDAPLTGAGGGSFESVYSAYKTVPSELLWDHAHNDYLEVAAETGLVGVLLWLWFFAAWFRHVLGRIRRRRSRYHRLVSIGALGGVVALLLHGLVDFNLRVGANAFLFFVLAGLAVAAGSVRTPPGRGSRLPEIRMPIGRRPRFVRPAALLTAGVLLLLFLRPALAELYYSAALDLARNRNPATVEERRRALRRAVRLDPTDFRYPYALAAEFGEGSDEAGRWIRRALRLNPAHYGPGRRAGSREIPPPRLGPGSRPPGWA